MWINIVQGRRGRVCMDGRRRVCGQRYQHQTGRYCELRAAGCKLEGEPRGAVHGASSPLTTHNSPAHSRSQDIGWWILLSGECGGHTESIATLISMTASAKNGRSKRGGDEFSVTEGVGSNLSLDHPGPWAMLGCGRWLRCGRVPGGQGKIRGRKKESPRMEGSCRVPRLARPAGSSPLGQAYARICQEKSGNAMESGR